MVEFSRLIEIEGAQPFTISEGEMRAIAAAVLETIKP